MLEALISVYPQALTQQSLQEATGYKTTTVYQTLKELRARKLVVFEGKSAKVADALFS